MGYPETHALYIPAILQRFFICRYSMAVIYQRGTYLPCRLVAMFMLSYQDKESAEEDISIKTVYFTMWNIVKLKSRSCSPRVLWAFLTLSPLSRRSNALPSPSILQDWLAS